MSLYKTSAQAADERIQRAARAIAEAKHDVDAVYKALAFAPAGLSVAVITRLADMDDRPGITSQRVDAALGALRAHGLVEVDTWDGLPGTATWRRVAS